MSEKPKFKFGLPGRSRVSSLAFWSSVSASRKWGGNTYEDQTCEDVESGGHTANCSDGSKVGNPIHVSMDHLMTKIMSN